MSSYLARLLGFAVPTVGFVLATHLNREAGWGEALDGVVSGLFFTLPFSVLTVVRSRFAPPRAGGNPRGSLHELAFGALAAAIAWCALWLGWTLPSLQPFRSQALAINAAVMAAAGLLLPPVRRAPRGPGVPELDEATTSVP